MTMLKTPYKHLLLPSLVPYIVKSPDVSEHANPGLITGDIIHHIPSIQTEKDNCLRLYTLEVLDPQLPQTISSRLSR